MSMVYWWSAPEKRIVVDINDGQEPNLPGTPEERRERCLAHARANLEASTARRAQRQAWAAARKALEG